jgi:hypothetical protein
MMKLIIVIYLVECERLVLRERRIAARGAGIKQALCRSIRGITYPRGLCGGLARTLRPFPARVHRGAPSQGEQMKRAETKSEKKTGSRRAEFVLARLGKGCWVVAYQGRLIGGAVLSSLPAAAAYAADIAHAFGAHNFLLTVVEAGRLAA